MEKRELRTLGSHPGIVYFGLDCCSRGCPILENTGLRVTMADKSMDKTKLSGLI